MTVLSEYRAQVLEDIGAPVVAPTGQLYNVGPGVKTAWINMTPRVPGEYVEACLVTFQTTVNASGGTASSVASAVNLDAVLNQVFVAPQGNTSPRSYTASRLASQEVERLTFGLVDSSISYPGTAIASIASGSSVTINSTLLVPIGGQAGAIAFQTAPTTQAYGGTAPTISSTITARVISGTNGMVTSFKSDFTNSLASGSAVDVTTYLSDPNISYDWLDFPGTSVTTLSGITVVGNDGSFLIDLNSGETSTILNLQSYIGQANKATASVAFNLRKQGVRKAVLNTAAAGALEVLRISYDNGVALVPPAATAPVAGTPSSTQTGVALPGNAVAVKKGGAGPFAGRGVAPWGHS